MWNRNVLYFRIMAILICSIPSISYALECPLSPDDISHEFKVETEGKLAKLGSLSGAELKNRTEVIAKNLLEKEPNLQARIYLIKMVASMYCSLLRDSKEFTDKEKLKELNSLQDKLKGYINKASESPANQKSESKNIDYDGQSNSSRKISIKADNKRGFTLIKEGLDYYFNGRLDDARQRYYLAQQLFEKSANKYGVAETGLHVGDVEGALGHYDNARSEYEKAMTLFRETQNRFGEANTLLRIGYLESVLSHHEDARNAYEVALPLFRAIHECGQLI